MNQEGFSCVVTEGKMIEVSGLFWHRKTNKGCGAITFPKEAFRHFGIVLIHLFLNLDDLEIQDITLMLQL